MFSPAIDTIKAIDTAFDSYYREFRLGKKKSSAIERNENRINTSDGVPIRYFDTNDEVYEAMNFGPDAEGMKPVEVSMNCESGNI